MTSLDITNFWDASVGIWTEISKVPENFVCFAKSKKSAYYTNDSKDTIVRVSDHWGSGVRQCNWYLSGHVMNNSFLWKKRMGDSSVKIGLIKISDLIDVRLEIKIPIQAEHPCGKKVKEENSEFIFKENKSLIAKKIAPLRAELRKTGNPEILKQIEEICNGAKDSQMIGKSSNRSLMKRVRKDYNKYLRKNGLHLAYVKLYGCDDCGYAPERSVSCQFCKNPPKVKYESNLGGKKWNLSEVPVTAQP